MEKHGLFKSLNSQRNTVLIIPVSKTQSSKHGMMVVMQKSIARRRSLKIPTAELARFSDFDEK